MRLLVLLMILSVLLSGCMQIHADRDDICTVPTTNNPQLIPRNNSQTPAN